MPHGFGPVNDKHSRILILGTIPSPVSRETGFYYGHPQNRFWRVLAALTGDTLPQSVDEKRLLLTKHKIALWDVLESCTITGAQDLSIREPVPNDLQSILNISPIQAVFLNGATAYKLYLRLISHSVSLPAFRLPSTSPANAAFSLDRLIGEWAQIKPYLT